MPDTPRCVSPVRHALHVTSMCATSGTGNVTLSPRARELFKLQVESPIFDVSAVESDKLRETLEEAQPSVPPHKLLTDFSGVESKAASTACSLLTEEAVTAARKAVLFSFEGIDQPGGKLYPEYRSDACWRDLMAFTRVAGYMCACGGDAKALSENGFDVLKQVYEELDVPVDAVIVGIGAIWEFSLNKAKEVVGASDEQVDGNHVCRILDASFRALLSRLELLI